MGILLVKKFVDGEEEALSSDSLQDRYSLIVSCWISTL